MVNPADGFSNDDPPGSDPLEGLGVPRGQAFGGYARADDVIAAREAVDADTAWRLRAAMTRPANGSSSWLDERRRIRLWHIVLWTGLNVMSLTSRRYDVFEMLKDPYGFYYTSYTSGRARTIPEWSSVIVSYGTLHWAVILAVVTLLSYGGFYASRLKH